MGHDMVFIVYNSKQVPLNRIFNLLGLVLSKLYSEDYSVINSVRCDLSNPTGVADALYIQSIKRLQ